VNAPLCVGDFLEPKSCLFPGSDDSRQALEVRRVEKAWSRWQLSQAVAKAMTMAKPYLPFSSSGLDSDPARI